MTTAAVAAMMVRLNYQEMLLMTFKDGFMSQKVIARVFESTKYFYQLIEEDFRYFKVMIYALKSF